MNKFALALAMKVVTGFLSKFAKEIAQDIWDSLWRIVKECVTEAERRWKESGTGKQKAEFMVTEALKFLESKKKLNFIQPFTGNANMLIEVVAITLTRAQV